METIDTNFPPQVEDISKGQYFKIIFGNEENTNVIDINQDYIKMGLAAIYYSAKSQSYLIEVIRNFIRKNNFSELNESLKDEEITEEQFNKIIDENAEKYVITLKNISNPFDVLIIANLVKKIGYDLKEFTTSDISEMFSVKENQLISHVNSLRNQTK
jgi:hypothetical protein